MGAFEVRGIDEHWRPRDPEVVALLKISAAAKQTTQWSGRDLAVLQRYEQELEQLTGGPTHRRLPGKQGTR